MCSCRAGRPKGVCPSSLARVRTGRGGRRAAVGRVGAAAHARRRVAVSAGGADRVHAVRRADVAAAGGARAGAAAGAWRCWRGWPRGALGVAMVPRAVAGPRPEADGPRLVVMTSNLWLGSADVPALLRIAREHDVDVLSVQELRPKTVARLERAGAAGAVPGPDPRAAARRAAGAAAVVPMRPLDVRPAGRRAAGGGVHRRGRAAGADQGRASAPARQPRRRAGVARRDRGDARLGLPRRRPDPRRRLQRHARPLRSCARCSTAATSTPPTPPARA